MNHPLSSPRSARLIVIFTPDRIKANPPSTDDQVLVVRAFREPAAFADGCADLRELGIQFRPVWLDGGGITDAQLAETSIARALGRSYGFDRVIVYNEVIREDVAYPVPAPTTPSGSLPAYTPTLLPTS